MPRPLRIAPAGVCFHVLNRGNNRKPLFRKEADYAAFLAILAHAVERFEVDLFCWCLMPNHWHLVLRPRTDVALSRFMAWLSITHVRRHHGHYPSFSGHLYQGRFKSFPVEADEYFLAVCRYVEANPLRATLAMPAEGWPWSSLWESHNHCEPGTRPKLSEWPVDRPRDWAGVVNEAMDDGQRQHIQSCLRRDCPFGSKRWAGRIAGRLKLTQTLKPIGRPRKPLKSLSARQRRRREEESRQIGR
ncbi:MAG: transposase [Phycisphaerae bacterium]|nr:transposase [Phycisphaerae bacterium]